MDVPFISSGALSRAHYAIVRNTELESSPRHVDQLLLDEIRRIRGLLIKPTISPAKCKECLIILLYCVTASPTGTIDDKAVYFALPHALNLAEAGKSVDAKRIGYLFCSEIMPPNHELQLMLVNTLRKDLESPFISQICLALDNIITLANDIIIPAVQIRLHDLLSHKVAHVRRRALLAFRSLARFQPELLEHIADNLTLRIKDSDQLVSCAALIVVSAVPESYPAADHVREAISNILHAQTTPTFHRDVFFRILQTLYITQASEVATSLAMDQLQRITVERSPALLLTVFRLMIHTASSELASRGKTFINVCIDSIRGLLTSGKPNDVYLFLSCLECIDSIFWSGKSPDFPATLEGWEVEHIMQQLDSADVSIRRKTLRILQGVDPGLLNTHYEIKLRAINANSDTDTLEVSIFRLLEVVAVQNSDDGESYARHFIDILKFSESVIPNIKHVILETVMKDILLQIQMRDINFRIGCASTVLTVLGDGDTYFGATMMVIIAVIATEYCHLISIHPSKLLSGLASRLEAHRPLVQDTCLLAILRVSIECDEISDNLRNTIQHLRDRSKSRIRRRCDQFLGFLDKRQTLVHLVQNARSASLPDFAEALERHEVDKATPASPSSESSGRGMTALRYTAYDTPRWIPRLRGQRHISADSLRSDENEYGVLSRIAAGNLALGAGSEEMEIISLGLNADNSTMERKQVVEENSNRVDLISLNSAFTPESSGEKGGKGEDANSNFEAMWETLGEESGVRGWHSGSIEKVVGELQELKGQEVKVISADVPRLQGETKVAITEGMMEVDAERGALLRLRAAEEGGSVWRLRSGDGGLRTAVKRKLWEE